MKRLAAARHEILEVLPRQPIEAVALDRSLGLVLSEEVLAPHPVPPFANSAMDGYAVRAADTEEAPVEFPVLEDLPAGSVAQQRVTPGTAIKIMTGAPLPEGADAVIKVEDTQPRPGLVRVLETVEVGTAVRPAGGDLEAGGLVLSPGRRLEAADQAVLASIGSTNPKVYRRPLVAVLSTGDELQPPETAALAPGQIRDSNRPLLTGLLAQLGAEVIDLGIIPDDESLLRDTLQRAAAEADAVLTSGGVSVGEYDLVKQVLSDLGEIEFWRVAMQPAKPFAFGSIEGTPLFGLPGNPVSVMVAYEQFVRPGLLDMMGADLIYRPRITAIADEAFTTDQEKTVFVRVVTAMEGDEWHARSSGGQRSNVLSALAAADAFAVVPVGRSVVGKGEPLTLEMFKWPESRRAREAVDE